MLDIQNKGRQGMIYGSLFCADFCPPCLNIQQEWGLMQQEDSCLHNQVKLFGLVRQILQVWKEQTFLKV